MSELLETQAEEEASREAAVESSTAVSVALAKAGRSRRKSTVDAFLEDQRALIGDQRHHMTVQLRQMQLRLWSERLRLGLQLASLVVATVVAGIVALVVWQSTRSHALVIEAISVPPDLAQQGLTGQAVAGQLQDQLEALQESAASARASTNFADSWSHDLKVEIPETGLSLGELERFLRERFGHDVHIRGELFHSPAGLTMSVRAGEASGARVSGPAADAEGLIAQAAAAVFAKTQPYQYAIWLSNHGRQAEADTIFRRLTTSPDDQDRLWALNGLAIAADSPAAARAIEARAVALDPAFSHGWLLIGRTDLALGWNEQALADTREGLRFADADRGRRVSEEATDWGVAIGKAILASETGDEAGADAALGGMLGRPEAPISRYYRSALLMRADAAAWRHDPARARALLADSPDDLTANLGLQHARAEVPHAWVAAGDGDWPAVIRQLEPLRTAAAPPSVVASFPARAWPLLAEAYARTGQLAKAQALLREVPPDVYDGWIARGETAAAGGDRRGADQAFAEAVRRAPSIPRAHKAWGDALAAGGDLDAAARHYAAAQQRGPRWADPLKAWGDLLVRQGRRREALEKYDAALALAPAWRALRLARDSVAR